MLFATYYYIQILAHRPFIVVRNQPVLAFSSLAICTNAARACIRITETQSKKGRVLNPQMQMALFMSGLMLILSIWRGKRTGITLMDERQEMQAVHSCINVLKTYEERWHLAGRFRDLLLALTCVSGCPLQPAALKHKTGKRSRETLEDEASSPTSGSGTPSMTSRHDTPSDAQTRSSPATSVSARSEPVSEPLPFVEPSMMHGQLPAPVPLTGLISHQQHSPEIPEGSPPSFDFPLYSNDLSKPFPFNPSDESGWDNAVLQQQLDELEAMFNARGPSAGQSGGVDGNAGMRGNNGGQQQQSQGQNHQDVFQKMLGEPSMFLTSSAPQQPSVPNVAPGIEGGGSLSSGSHDFSSYLFSGSGLLDIQGAAIWTGVPSGTDLNDWRAYFSNVEGLKPGSSLYSAGLSAPNHHIANPFSSGSFQQQEQHVPLSASSSAGNVRGMNDPFGGQSHRSDGDFSW
ncbi:hypothetical protein H1R20_g1690, partial [Candolleomyces eurysporus]